MRRRLISSCIALLLLGGCASYKPTATLVERVTDNELVFNAEGYGAKVEPYLDKARQQRYFNADFTKAGFLVVDVVVKNEGKDPVEVRPYDIYLVFPGGTQMSPMEGKVVATQIEENGSVVGSVLMFGLVGGIVATQAEHDAKNARILDYGAKELKETALAPGASTQGYLFYRWTPSASAQAEFVLQLQNRASNQLTEVTVPYENTKVFAVPQNALFVASPPPATPAVSQGTTQTASAGNQAQGSPTTSVAQTGPVDVPFKIDYGVGVVEGTAQLQDGHLAGQSSLGGRPIAISGTLKDRKLSINVNGAIISPGLAMTGSGIGYYCSGSAELDNAVGDVTIALPAACGTENIRDTVYLELPPANPSASTGAVQAASIGTQGTPAAAPASGPVDVPFKIEYEALVAEGVAQLENGQLLGHASNNGRPITLKGTLKDRQLSIEVYGGIFNFATSGGSMGKYCSGEAHLDHAAGPVTIPLPVVCGARNSLDSVYLELPAT